MSYALPFLSKVFLIELGLFRVLKENICGYGRSGSSHTGDVPSSSHSSELKLWQVDQHF